jgi:hypothetical protein
MSTEHVKVTTTYKQHKQNFKKNTSHPPHNVRKYIEYIDPVTTTYIYKYIIIEYIHIQQIKDVNIYQNISRIQIPSCIEIEKYIL